MINLFSSFDLAQATLLLADFDISKFALGVLLFATSLWLIFLVLIQRGKGGGLTGALGGSGGGSAFGAKAGDAFTKVTVISATVWIFLCMVTIAWVNPPPPPMASDDTPALMGDAEDETADGAAAGDSTTSGDAASSNGESTTATENAAPETTSPESTTPDENAFEPNAEGDGDNNSEADSAEEGGSGS
jgi:preprotein translocase subunit SecG